MDKLVRHFIRPDYIDDKLYVICVMFNPLRWRVRWKLYEDFIKRVREAGAIPVKVEVAFGDREFAVTGGRHKEDGDIELQLRTDDPLWLKENAINLAVQRLPSNWQYVAWIDTDITFSRDDWSDEIVHTLQHYPIIQPWSKAINLDSNYESTNQFVSVGWAWINGYWHNKNITSPIDISLQQNNSYYYELEDRKGVQRVYPHCGFAYACTRYAWDIFGGLLDVCILGSADYVMAYSLLGQPEIAIDKNYSVGYINAMLRWSHLASKLGKRFGYCEGTILHHWHGTIKNRKYNQRWKTLIDCKYDPAVDLHRDYQGLWQLTEHNHQLREALWQYSKNRNEDEIG